MNIKNTQWRHYWFSVRLPTRRLDVLMQQTFLLLFSFISDPKTNPLFPFQSSTISISARENRCHFIQVPASSWPPFERYRRSTLTIFSWTDTFHALRPVEANLPACKQVFLAASSPWGLSQESCFTFIENCRVLAKHNIHKTNVRF